MMKLNVDLSYQILMLSRGETREIRNKKTDPVKIIITSHCDLQPFRVTLHLIFPQVL